MFCTHLNCKNEFQEISRIQNKESKKKKSFHVIHDYDTKNTQHYKKYMILQTFSCRQHLRMHRTNNINILMPPALENIFYCLQRCSLFACYSASQSLQLHSSHPSQHSQNYTSNRCQDPELQVDKRIMQFCHNPPQIAIAKFMANLQEL